MYVSCCTMITIVVLTAFHLDIVAHWVWLWVERMSSAFDAGVWHMIRWSNKTCVVVNTCSSCIIPLLLTWWERIDMLDDCCVLSCIVYMFMIWYEFCCYMYFSSISINMCVAVWNICVVKQVITPHNFTLPLIIHMYRIFFTCDRNLVVEDVRIDREKMYSVDNRC